MREFGRMYGATTVRPDIHARVQAIVQRVDDRVAADWARICTQVEDDALEQYEYRQGRLHVIEPVEADAVIVEAFRAVPEEVGP